MALCILSAGRASDIAEGKEHGIGLNNEYEYLLDCQARWFLNPRISRERKERIWRNWTNPDHRNYRGDGFEQDMRKRIERLRNCRLK